LPSRNAEGRFHPPFRGSFIEYQNLPRWPITRSAGEMGCRARATHPAQRRLSKKPQFNNPGAASLQGILTLKWDGATSLQPFCTVQRTLRCIAPRHLTRRKTRRCIAPTHFHSQMGRRHVAPRLSHSQMTRSDVATWSLNSEKGTERPSAMSFSLSNKTERCSGGSVELSKNVPPRSPNSGITLKNNDLHRLAVGTDCHRPSSPHNVL
jgi:hypothetical protein